MNAPGPIAPQVLCASAELEERGRAVVFDVLLWRQPALMVALLGVGVSLSGLTLWPPLATGIKFLGDISLGLMIFSLGVRLATAHAVAPQAALALKALRAEDFARAQAATQKKIEDGSMWPSWNGKR